MLQLGGNLDDNMILKHKRTFVPVINSPTSCPKLVAKLIQSRKISLEAGLSTTFAEATVVSVAVAPVKVDT